MWSGKLQQDFGLLDNTTATSKVLKEKYIAPEGTSKSMIGMLHMIG